MCKMIHNKYYNLLTLYCGDYAREIHGRAIIGKVPLSQKGIAIALEELKKENILKSRKTGNMKYFKLNLKNTALKDIIEITENIKKIRVFEKHRKLAYLFKEDKRIVGIFGSYAKGAEKKESDVDVFIVGKKKQDDYQQKGRMIDLDVSIKYFSGSEFKKLLKQKNTLCKEIVTNHILVFNKEEFIDFIWRYYYGFH